MNEHIRYVSYDHLKLFVLSAEKKGVFININKKQTRTESLNKVEVTLNPGKRNSD